MLIYKQIERWKFPLDRGVGEGRSPQDFRDPLEFPRGNSDQRERQKASPEKAGFRQRTGKLTIRLAFFWCSRQETENLFYYCAVSLHVPIVL